MSSPTKLTHPPCPPLLLRSRSADDSKKLLLAPNVWPPIGPTDTASWATTSMIRTVKTRITEPPSDLPTRPRSISMSGASRPLLGPTPPGRPGSYGSTSPSEPVSAEYVSSNRQLPAQLWQIAEQQRGVSKKLYWATLSMFFFYGVAWGNWTCRLAAFKNELNASDIAFGALLGAHMVGYVGGILARPHFERIYSFKQSTRGAGAGFSFLLAATPRAHTLSLAACSMAMVGSASGIFDRNINLAASRLVEHGRHAAVDTSHTMFNAGSVVGGLMGWAAASYAIDIDPHIGAVGVSLALLSAASGHWVADLPAANNHQASTRASLWNSHTYVLGALTVASAVGKAAMADWLGVYLHEQLKEQLTVASFGYVAFSFSSFIGELMRDHVIPTPKPAMAIFAGSAVTLAALGFGLWHNSVTSVVIGAAVASFGLSTFRPGIASTASQLFSGENARAMQFIASCQSAGYLLGPILIGFSAQYINKRTALAMVVAAEIPKILGSAHLHRLVGRIERSLAEGEEHVQQA